MMTKPDAAPGDALEVAPVLQAHRDRQHQKLVRLPATERPSAFFAEMDRWNQELTDDLTPLVGEAAAALAFESNYATLQGLDVEDAA
jgi:hypothetical protein